MNGNAPNCSVTGSQVEVVRKPRPNFLSATEDPCQSCHPSKVTSTITASAIASVRHLNALSPNRDGGAMCARAERSSMDMCAVLIVVILSEAKNHRSFFRQHQHTSQRCFAPAQHDRLARSHFKT